MRSLFIIGNGFDLAHGLPTKYSDFKNFLIAHYPEASNITLQFNIEQYDWEDYDKMAAHLLFYTMNKSCGPDWNDFENALGELHIHDTFPKRSNTIDENGEHDDSNIVEYLLHLDKLANMVQISVENWQDFFETWIKSIEHKLENGQYLSRESLIELFNKPGNLFLNFNYTRTLKKVYDVKPVIHIHNRVGQNLIFGHGNNKSSYDGGVIGSSTLDDILEFFRKDTVKSMKKYHNFFRDLNCDINKVYSYGFSYGSVDSIYIKTIIQKISKDATWYFSKFEANNKEMFRIKKVKLRKYGFKGTFDIFEG